MTKIYITKKFNKYNTLFRYINNDKIRFGNIYVLFMYILKRNCVSVYDYLKTTWDNFSKLFTIIWKTEEVYV